MAFTSKDVMELRKKTGAGVADCQKALKETDGDMEKAVDFLREKGMATAAKKASRIAAEGIVAAKVEGNVGALVEVNCETDFVARGDQFKTLVHDIAMHIAALGPKYVSSEQISAEEVAKEREILLAQALNENETAAKPKPQQIIEKMVEGRLVKNFKEICLLDQPFVKNPDQTVAAYVKSKGCSVVSFVRLAVGEGIEKEVVDFAAEVAAQAGLNK